MNQVKFHPPRNGSVGKLQPYRPRFERYRRRWDWVDVAVPVCIGAGLVLTALLFSAAIGGLAYLTIVLWQHILRALGGG